jgi:hypothetical protein
MKKIFSLIAISLLALIPIKNTQAGSRSAEFLLNVNVYNATGSNGSIYMSGPSPINATVYPGSNNVGSISAGTYTITMYASYGEHDYIFNGIHQTTYNGQATFYNVSINNNVNAWVGN